MTVQQEWHQLRLTCMRGELSSGRFKNHFYKRLLYVLSDTQAGTADRVAAYRDALLATPTGNRASLPLVGLQRSDAALLDKGGIRPDSTWHEVGLSDGCELQSDEGIVSLEPIYTLTRKRNIARYPIDPSLASLLNDNSYQNYNGNSQQMAVRLALTTKLDSTLLINLPTGSGKTLVAHALCGFAPANKLTLVIVPTIGLSIDQGRRALIQLEKMGLGHGGCYYWHGQQNEQLHNDIRDRIHSGKQRILFCSPETACRSLLPTLFRAVENDLLANIVIDEAHLVDHWGAEFRPYFQIFSAVFHSLRRVSRHGIKCVLMSATFTEKTLNILSDLFAVDDHSPIEIHGSFLRPEIQYSLHRVAQENHFQEVMKSVWRLPKPIIVYTVKVDDANEIYKRLCSNDFSRVGLFTGETSTVIRGELLEEWSRDKIDIMVATSAFGVGMDKDNVRSVLHAGIPENLDRFYQEVGRAGRDGIACQSLLLYHTDQFRVAKRLNNQRLITKELGLKRWMKMWNTGKIRAGGKKIIDIKTLHDDLPHHTDSNEEWNWRTLLLMQRSGMIEIELDPPESPDWDPHLDEIINQRLRSEYYDRYYRDIVISPVIDSHLSSMTWEQRIGQQRGYEKDGQKQGFKKLKKWINQSNTVPLCQELMAFYTVRNRQPEYVCGGCPGCRREGRSFHDTPTVGRVCHVIGLGYPKRWKDPIHSDALYLPVYYSSKGGESHSRLIRKWINWITELLEQGTITAIRAEESTLFQINKRLPTGLRKFWVGIPFVTGCDEPSFWPELVLLMPGVSNIPETGLEESPRLIVAPDDVPHTNHYNCAWWEKDNNAKSLDNFLLGLSYGNH